MLGLNASFYKHKEDESALYIAEIWGMPYHKQLIDEFNMTMEINYGYVDYTIELSKDELYNHIILYYGKKQCRQMEEQNPRLMTILNKGEACEKIILKVYEYEAEAILEESELNL